MGHYKVTNHARVRMADRAGIGRKRDIKKEFQLALKYGDISKIEDEEFLDYLEDRMMTGKGVKVYNGMIFIHKNHTLITVYDIPDRFR